jgi:hypothetical protein
VLDNLVDFLDACEQNRPRIDKLGRFVAGDLYCPVCGGPRRVRIEILHPRNVGGDHARTLAEPREEEAQQLARHFSPGLFVLTCLQCSTTSTAVMFVGPHGFELAIFPAVAGGVATANTPRGVAYYLDQAQRAQNVGANSAAVAMYRSALEHLLYEQGFEMRMLGPKIGALEQGIQDGSAPRWARDLNPAYLTAIKKLGDAAIHPGEGDVGRQASLDSSLLRQLRITFSELLQVVYEREHEEAERLAALRQALSEVEGVPESSSSGE